MVFVNTEANDTGLYMCTAINSELDKSVAGSLTFLEVAGKDTFIRLCA